MQESLFGEETISSSINKDLAWLRTVDYSLVDTDDSVDSLFEHLQQCIDRGSKLIGMDTETNGLSYMQHHTVGLCLSAEKGVAFYIPIRHLQGTNLPFDQYIRILNWIKSQQMETVWFNAKFDWHFITADLGHDSFPFTHDVQLSLKLRSSNDKFPDLKGSTKEYLDIDMIDFMDNFSAKDRKTANFANLLPQDAVNYAAADPDMTLRLHHKFFNHDLVQRQLNIYKMEMNLIPALGRQERKGIGLNVPQLQSDLVRLDKILDELSLQFIAASALPQGTKVDGIINSPKKLSDLLFGQLAIPHPDSRATKGKNNAYPTGKNHMSRLIQQGIPIASIIQNWKKLSTFKSRTLMSLPLVISKDGKLHTSYSSFDANTGRLSSKSLLSKIEGTNLQQISKPKEAEGMDTEEIFSARASFVPESGYYVMSIDFSQIEYRIAAGMTGETSLIKGFEMGIDYHTNTAALAFKVPVGKVTSAMRNKAKTINFGANYGQQAAGLAQTLNISRAEAQKTLDDYWSGLPNTLKFKKNLISEASKTLYVGTIYGRLRDVSGLNSATYSDRGFWERTTFSHLIQGSAADIMKETITKIDQACYQPDGKPLPAAMGIVPVMNIHDEIVFMIPEKVQAKIAAEYLIPFMVQRVPGWPVLSVDAEYGPNWGTMQAVPDLDSSLVQGKLAATSLFSGQATLSADATRAFKLHSATLSSPEEKLIVKIETEIQDPARFEAFTKIAAHFPGTYRVVFRIRSYLIKTELFVDPNPSFRDYTNQVFQSTQCVTVFDSLGSEEQPAVIFSSSEIIFT